MGTIQRSRAGQRLWDQHIRNLRPFLYFTILVAVVLPVLMFVMLPTQPEALDWNTVLQYAALIFFAGAAFFFPNFWNRRYGNNEKGARGEIAVGRELEKLCTEGFHIFHDYKPEKFGNVDHFLVGENGVFIVETKAWNGVITSDGSNILKNGRRCDKSPIRQAISEARSIRELLNSSCGISIWVQPMLCFVEGNLRVFGKIGNVEATSLGALNRTIMQQANENPDYRCLSSSQVKSISRRLSKHLGETPAASPGKPPETPGRSKRFLMNPRVWVAAYAVFIFVLTVVFAEKTAVMFEGLASLYKVLGFVKSSLP